MRGNPGNVQSGDKLVQDLINDMIMKEWMDDGVRMCSYRNIKVAIEDGVKKSSGTSKDFFLICPSPY